MAVADALANNLYYNDLQNKSNKQDLFCNYLNINTLARTSANKIRTMPIISRFYGISILMFFKEHNPPHFHAKYSGKIAVFNIRTHEIMAGDLPTQAKKLIRTWAKLHEDDLIKNWELARKDGKLKTIEPLE